MNITVTPSAAKKISDLLASESESTYLRIFVRGGGCSGFQYGFAFDQPVDDEDFIIITEGAKLAIDPMSAQYLDGATIEYIEELMGAHFSINNPNATTTCGCGSSFSV
jgi:iron-sulfur cluster insertion protein